MKIRRNLTVISKILIKKQQQKVQLKSYSKETYLISVFQNYFTINNMLYNFVISPQRQAFEV